MGQRRASQCSCNEHGSIGILLKDLGDISLEEVEMALKERFKGDLFKLNMAAVKIGLEASEF